MKRLILLLIACSCIVSVHAAYLKDVPMTLTQPDGTVLHCFASGDEFFNYLHDANGFTIMQHPQTGYYVYAEKRDGKLVATNYVAGVIDPASKGLTPHALISPEEWMARRRARERKNEPHTDAGLTHGTLNNIVIFIRFNDENEFTHSFSSIDNMFNNESQNANSLINYFKSASYNALTISTSFYPGHNGDIIVSYQDIHPRNYYQPHDAVNNPNGYTNDEVEREFGLLERAINCVKDSIPSALNIDHNNDGFVDNVCFIVKGDVDVGEDQWHHLLWPHQWTLHDRDVYINEKRVYTFNFLLEEVTYTMYHEMNHSLGAPDLYHYPDENNVVLGPDPVGKWDLMNHSTTPPQHCGAYMKMRYGHWINEIPEITQAGTYTLNPISSPTSTNVAYKIPTSNPNQFYVVEYRKNTTLFETELPGSGLLIYRIDDRYNGNAYYDQTNIYDEVYIFRPGGTSNVNGDLNHAYFNSDEGRTEFGASSSASAYPFFTGGTPDNYFRIYNITSAGNTISFDYGPEPPTNVVASVDDNDVSLSWDAAPYAQSYKIYRDGSLIANTSGTTYFDSNLEYGCYSYRLKSVDVKGLLSKASEPAVAIIVPEDIDTIYYSETICRRAGFFGVFGQGNNVVTVSLSRDETDFDGSQTFYRSIKNSVTGTVTGILILTITTEGAVSEHTLPPVTVNRCDLIDDDNCYHWNIGDESYCCNHTDRYEKVFNREGECDSVVYLDLTIIEPESTVFEDTLLCFNSFCQPFNYHGKQITTAGIYYVCENDVFYTLDVGLIDTIRKPVDIDICTDEAPYTWHGHTLPWTTPGFYETIFRGTQWECQCDTVYYIYLNIRDCCEPPLDCLEDELEDGDRSNSSNLEAIYYGLKHYFDYRGAMNGFLANVLRGVTWPSIEERNTFWNLFQSLLDANSGMMSEEAMQQLITANPYTYVSENYITDLVERYNRSVMYWNEGLYSVWYLPQGYNPDNFIEYDTASMNKAYETYDYAIAHGFSDVKAMYDNAYELLAAEVDNIQSAVCARVTVQFNQKMTMTREAFNGTLQIFNGHESIPMEDIFVDFRIEDQQGNDCTDLFQINTISLDQITGISGDGSLAAQTNGTALVQFIPTKNAAPTQPVVYSFGGSFSFIDPFTGEGLTYPLYPVDITVNPSPDLHVDYFMQRDILGDDALTLDVVEPSVPAELGVIINNKGAGMAKNVLLETAEPQIIDNEKGLAIDFAMYGASFNGSPRQLGLMEIPFGNIGSGQTAVGEWLFTSSLLGHFVSYEAHVIHNSSYGNPDLSLVSHLDIHELIHPIYAYGTLDDGINDFLVNDNPDAYDTPDSIYFSHGGKTSVGVVDGISYDHLVSPSDTIVTLTVVPSRIGWNYGVTDDPGMNQYNIVSCIRNNDNQVIPLNNVWLTFVTIPDGGDPVYENKLHIVDTIPVQHTTTYTLVYTKSTSQNNSMTQSMTLAEGWNWWSSYVDLSDGGLEQLEAALNENGVCIKSQYNGFVMNNSGHWEGNLTTLDNKYMYRIQMNETDVVAMNGVRINPAHVSLSIQPGWNWVGYPLDSPLGMETAFSNYEATANDIIKGMKSFAIYYEGLGWIPTTFVLTPGQGYMYKSFNPSAQTLTFADGRNDFVSVAEEPTYWQANVHAFADNLNIVAVVMIDGEELREEDVELGAFVNDECRGSAKLYHVEPIDYYIAFLTVTGQDGEQVEFRLINHNSEFEIKKSCNHIGFQNNAVFGSLDNPFPIHFGTTNNLTEVKMNVSIYPNPVDCNTPFRLMIPEGETVAEVLVVDALGEVVSHETGSLTRSMVHGIPTAGVYMLKVTCKSGNVYQGRIVVK